MHGKFQWRKRVMTIVERLSKGHFGVSIVERLSSSQRCQNLILQWEQLLLGHYEKCPFMRGCPFLRGSFTGGSTVCKVPFGISVIIWRVGGGVVVFDIHTVIILNSDEGLGENLRHFLFLLHAPKRVKPAQEPPHGHTESLRCLHDGILSDVHSKLHLWRAGGHHSEEREGTARERTIINTTWIKNFKKRSSKYSGTSEQRTLWDQPYRVHCREDVLFSEVSKCINTLGISTYFRDIGQVPL